MAGDFKLKLRGKTCVFIDWANVHGWSNHQKPVNPEKLFNYLKQYTEILEVRFYFGLDKNKQSQIFLEEIKKIGYTLITKNVKYIPVSIDSSLFKNIALEIKQSICSIKNINPHDIQKILQILNKKILRRKCDFDIEIAMDVYSLLGKAETFIFFSGDGDFAPLFKFLISKNKQVIVVFGEGHLGKEVMAIKRGIFLCDIKNIPSIS